MNETDAIINAFLHEREQEIIDTVENIVNIDSGSRNIEGTTAVATVLSERLAQYGIEVQLEPSQGAGPLLVAHINQDNTSQAPISFLGHMDTVFPDGTAAEHPFSIDDNGNAHGPGVVDMEPGAVIAVYTLIALNQLSTFTQPVQLVLVSDEENLHMFSNAREIIQQHTQTSQYVLNFETGQLDDGIVLSRKGGMIVDIEVFGKAAHSGMAVREGRSAILDIAHKIIAIEALNDIDNGILLNCGKIEGGIGENVIPDYAKVSIGARFDTVEQRDYIINELTQLSETAYVEDTRTHMNIRTIMDAMMRTDESEKLFEKLSATARRIGYGSIHASHVNGVSDAGITSSLGIPTLCALGARGTGAHSSTEEYSQVASYVQRAQLAACFVAQQGE